MKKIIFIALSTISALISINVFANTVYKCTDDKNNTSYINEDLVKTTPYKSMKCNKQELGDLMMIKNQDDGSKSQPSNASINGNNINTQPNLSLTKNMSISSEEQNKKNEGRKNILHKELTSEKQALEKVEQMLSTAPKTDSEQIKKLDELKKNHLMNIELLTKEFNKASM